MTIQNFFTTQITGQSQASLHGTAVGKIAEQAQSGLAFFDQFLLDAEKSLDLQLNALQTQQTTTETPPPLLSETTNFNILEALANSEFTMEELGKIKDPTLQDVLALNQQVTDEQLLQVKPPGSLDVSSVQESIAITSEPNFREALSNLQRILQKIETLVKNESPSLIGTNVTPQQITDLQKKVDNLLNGITEDGKTEAEEFAGIFAGLIQILPPQAKAPKPDTAIVAEASIEIPAGTEPTDDLASKLNDLVVGGTEEEAIVAPETSQVLQAPQAPEKNSAPVLTEAGLKITPEKLPTPEAFKFADLTESMDTAEGETTSVVKTDTNANTQQAANQNKPQSSVAPDLSTIKAALPFLFSGDLSSGLYTSATPAGGEYGLQYSSFTALSQGPASSLLASAPQAALPHPGTQMVAATLQRAGAAGESTTMTLQLDPPELGRVEIKMSFDKNSKIKAVLTAEKPETHTMLQRDSSVLERALQDAGLDTQDGLSFELAKEGYTFGQDEGKGGHGKNTRAGATGEDDIIQTTMSWDVDPETGHMHYNILA